MAKRTPSPRVIAAKLLKDVFNGPYQMGTGMMSYAADTKVSDDKRTKVIEQLDKLVKPLRAKIAKILDNFDKPPPRKKPNARPEGTGA